LPQSGGKARGSGRLGRPPGGLDLAPDERERVVEPVRLGAPGLREIGPAAALPADAPGCYV